MLIAAGLKPFKAAIVSLLANTAPVAFGALAAPIFALVGVTGLPLQDLSSMAGRQTPFMALLVPLILVFLVDGRRGLKQTWPVALVAGVVFGGVQFLTSNYFAVELTDVFVTLTDRSQWQQATTQEALATRIEMALTGMPGMRAAITQPIEMRMNEMAAGLRADVGVKIFGDDLDGLRQQARRVEAILKGIDGATDIAVEQTGGAPMVQVVLDRQALARHGIAGREVLDVVSALGGLEVSELQEGERRTTIAVRLSEGSRDSPEALGSVLVAAKNGDHIPLRTLARITRSEGPSTISREWGTRRIVVQANVRGRDVGGFVAEARHRIDAELKLPTGWYVRFGGQFEHLDDARTRLLLVVPLALALICSLLFITYGRAVDAARVVAGIPFAAVGGVVALLLRDIPFSVSAAVGFIAVSGVAVLGDMVLVSTIRHHRDRGMGLPEAVRAAASERLRPVLMTSLVAGLGFVPMALNTGLGAEVQRPLATVVIGGVISSTLLTLIILPVLAVVLGDVGPTARPVAAAAGPAQ